MYIVRCLLLRKPRQLRAGPGGQDLDPSQRDAAGAEIQVDFKTRVRGANVRASEAP